MREMFVSDKWMNTYMDIVLLFVDLSSVVANGPVSQLHMNVQLERKFGPTATQVDELYYDHQVNASFFDNVPM
jgi:hypothetical protein